jgi:5-formyltetrahydrofolate cyclo-ligase
VISKQQLRSEIAGKRKAVDESLLESASREIISNLISTTAFKTSSTIALYMAIRGEINLNNLFGICWKAGKKTCIPVYNDIKKQYEMALVTRETQFTTGHYGIKEPENPTPMALKDIDLMVVPGAAFDRTGNRLGRGGGYYDRFLFGFSGVSVAVSFDFQVIPSVPTDSHDEAVDLIVTNSEIIDVCNEH